MFKEENLLMLYYTHHVSASWKVLNMKLGKCFKGDFIQVDVESVLMLFIYFNFLRFSCQIFLYKSRKERAERS